MKVAINFRNRDPIGRGLDFSAVLLVHSVKPPRLAPVGEPCQ